MEDRSRRRFLATSAAAFAAVTAGCMIPGGVSDDDSDGPVTMGENTDDSGTGGSDSSDQDSDSWSTVEPVIDSETNQYHVDWRNTGWLTGTPISDEPERDWSYELESHRDFFAAGISADDVAYYLRDDGRLIGLDVGTGEVTANRPTGIVEEGALAFADGSILATGYIQGETHDSYITSINSRTDDVEWSNYYNGRIAGTTTVFEDTVYQGEENGVLYAYALDDGTSEWDADLGDPVIGSPVVDEESVYVTTESELKCLRQTTGIERWNVELSGSPTGGPILYGDIVLIQANPVVGVVRSDDGDDVWDESIADSYTGTAVADELLLACVEEPVPELRAMNAFSGTAEWTADLEQPAVGNPVVVDDVVYLPVQSGVIGFSLDNGHRLWGHEVPGRVTHDLAVASDRVLVQTTDGIYCISV